jgi:hypothetical protein
MIQTKSLDLFAGIPVADYAAAREWYERLLGSPPAFFPHDTEAVWEVAETRHKRETRTAFMHSISCTSQWISDSPTVFHEMPVSGGR